MKKKALIIIIPIIVILFKILVVFNSVEVMEAARSGVVLWFNSVLPSLLPFMIGTNLLLRLGVVDFIGLMLEPVMRPLFGVSGKGAFALAMGATSGYPIGAKICAELREGEKISRVEAQRLLSFVNNSGPLFMIGAVGVGMFDNERVGFFIMTANLSGALISGFIFKFYKRGTDEHSQNGKRGSKEILGRAETMKIAAEQPFGAILSESVVKALESLMAIGGFIILFSVLLEILDITEFMAAVTNVLQGFGITLSMALAEAGIYGFFEITNGASRLAAIGESRSVLVLTAALVSFGGLSIFSQSIAFLSKTDISSAVFFLSKLLNAALTAVVGFFIYPLWDFGQEAALAVPAFAATGPVDRLLFSTIICAMALLTILVSAFAVRLGSSLKGKRSKRR